MLLISLVVNMVLNTKTNMANAPGQQVILTAINHAFTPINQKKDPIMLALGLGIPEQNGAVATHWSG